MSVCQKCGEIVPDTAKFCRNCGAPIVAKPITPPQQAAKFEERTELLEEEPEPLRYQEPANNDQPAQSYQSASADPRPAATTDEYDHTAEFDPKDISENKVVAMLVYLMGFIGVIIALLKSSTSQYAEFHVRQGLKFIALDCLIVIVESVLFWFLILGGGIGALGSMAGYGYGMSVANSFAGLGVFAGFMFLLFILVWIFAAVLFVVKVICFFSVCKGRAKEPVIVRSMPFMK